MESNWKVSGRLEGIRINEVVLASTMRQAKYRGAYEAGVRGFYLTSAADSRKIKARRVG